MQQPGKRLQGWLFPFCCRVPLTDDDERMDGDGMHVSLIQLVDDRVQRRQGSANEMRMTVHQLKLSVPM